MGAAKKTILDFPNEVLEQIVAVVDDPHDVSALTYSSSRFWYLADPDRYRSVAIGNHAENLDFKNAIKRKPQRAAVVRSLDIDRRGDWRPYVEEAVDADDKTIKDDPNTEISILPKLVNLTTYRVIAAEHGAAFQTVLSLATKGLCLNGLKTCKLLELTSFSTCLLLDRETDQLLILGSLKFLPKPVLSEGGWTENSVELEAFPSLFAIPTLEDLTIRGCSVDKFQDLVPESEVVAAIGTTSLRRLRWLEGDIGDEALEQILKFPRCLHELAIQVQKRYLLGSVDAGYGFPDNWNLYGFVITECQPQLRRLTLDTDLELDYTAPLDLTGLPSLQSFFSHDYILFANDSYRELPSSTAERVLLPPSLEILGLINTGLDLGPIYEVLRRVSCGQYSLSNLRYNCCLENSDTSHNGIQKACDEAGVVLEEFYHDEEM